MIELSVREVPSTKLLDFDCGDDKLNLYLSTFAKQNDIKGIGRTFVLMEGDDVEGFYTLSSAQIAFEQLPLSLKKSLPKYPVPSIRIARLVVRRESQNKGIGSLILTNIFKRILSISSSIGIAFVIVDAKEESKGFYEHFGFTCIDKEKLLYVLPIATILKAVIN